MGGRRGPPEGQRPAALQQDGRISRFGTLDASNGGTSSRASLALEAWRAGSRSLSRLTAYAVTSDLDLFSNFTYFLGDLENGDQFGQKDRRTYLGAAGQERRETTLLGHAAELRWGFDLRADWIDNGLLATRERVQLATVREDEIQLVMPAVYGEALFALAPKVRSIVGLRADGYWADVESDRAAHSGRDPG